MEAVDSGYPHKKHVKSQRNRKNRSVDLVTRQSGMTKNNYNPRFATFSDGNKQPPLLPLPVVVPTTAHHQNLARHQSITSRKSPPSKATSDPSAPDPDKLRRVFMVPTPSPPAAAVAVVANSGDYVFALAPPPSSLPLPRFCLRPNAEAGVDSGDGFHLKSTTYSVLKTANLY